MKSIKQSISIFLCLCLAVCAASLGACGKKHIIDTDVALDGSESLSGSAGVVYENVTDEKGENVTNAQGETVTVAVPVEATSGKQETRPGETTVRSSETATKKEETTAAKTETTTKKNESSAGKETTTAKKSETTAAGQTPTQAPATQAQQVTVNPGDYQFELRADKTEVSPGDTVTVTLKLKNCKNVACFNIYVKCSARNGVVETEKFKSNRFSDDDGNNFDIYSNNEDKANTGINAEEKGVLFGGMTSTAYSFMGDDLCTVTYKVTSEAKKGDTLVFSAVPQQFLVSPDESGTYTQNCAEDVSMSPLMVTVK